MEDLNGDIDSGPLDAAAKDFRQRLSSELEMFAIVSVLLSAMAFAAFATVPDTLIMPDTPANGTTRIVTDTPANGPTWNVLYATTSATTAVPHTRLFTGFLVCDFMTFLLGLTLTGMYVRLSTVLRYCPSGRYIVWFIYRFEPAFALMHIAFMCAIHCALLAALFVAWFAWRQIVKEEVMIGLTCTAAACLLYFEYTWANSMFCRDHGLLGIIGRTIDHPCEVRHAYYVSRLMDCCTLLLSQQPFKLYTAERVCGGVVIKVKAAFDDLPCSEVSWSYCVGEGGRVVMVAPLFGGDPTPITGCKDTQLLHAAASHVVKAHSWLSPCSFWRVLSCLCYGRQRKYPQAAEQHSHAIDILNAAIAGNGGGLLGVSAVQLARDEVVRASVDAAFAAVGFVTGVQAEQAAKVAVEASRGVLRNVV
jgi:hypothetical protein